MQSTKTSNIPEVPCEIEKGLYLGSVQAANNKIALKSLNIKHILKVSHNLQPQFPNEFIYKIIRIPDIEHVNIGNIFTCGAGVSRSATIVLAYLMIKYGLSYDAAVDHVKKKRPVISPNIGFRMQLEYFENFLRGRWFRFTFRIALVRRQFTETLRCRNIY